jgi:suppressor of ftsI/bilirubin oxidase
VPFPPHSRFHTPRRGFLKALAALGISSLAVAARADQAKSSADDCGGGHPAGSLLIPTDRGWFGRLAPGDGDIVSLRAAPVAASRERGRAALTLAYLATYKGREYRNPTLVFKTGQRVRIELVNQLDQPTIVHWHGLRVDSRNDGGGMTLAAPGERYAYDFQVRDRAALYWYHPHPHGRTAEQTYRGLFGLIEVEDDDERRLRAALQLIPGKNEIPLVIQDRRPGSDYAASDADSMHGLLGDAVFINGGACGHLDVASRVYRFRVLNASNARTYRLGLRTAGGKPLPFVLIGGDGGLLTSPRSCDEAFLASAERIDVLVDLSGAAIGETVMLETRAFEPMHMEMAATPGAQIDHAATGHAMPASGAAPATSHTAMEHGGAFPEGVARSLLQLRVRKRIPDSAKPPSELSRTSAIDVDKASERPLRLGFSKGQWRINDRVFAMGETPIEVKRDTVEIWLIRNYFNSMPHAMHLHGFHFQVLERQTSPDQIAALKIDDRGLLATDLGWKDTVLVWPGESVKIAIDFAMPFAGPQTYMFHCHNLEHEDSGMMLGVKVA